MPGDLDSFALVETGLMLVLPTVSLREFVMSEIFLLLQLLFSTGLCPTSAQLKKPQLLSPVLLPRGHAKKPLPWFGPTEFTVMYFALLPH